MDLTLPAAFTLWVAAFAVGAFLADLGLVTEDVDLAETGAGAARGDADVFEDIMMRVENMGETRNEHNGGMETKIGKPDAMLLFKVAYC